MPSDAEKGFIKPLAPSAIPLIDWRMRNVADDKQPRGDDTICTPAPTATPSRPTARRWAWIWTARRTTRASTRMVPVAEKMTIRNRGHDLVVIVPGGESAARCASASCRRFRPTAGTWSPPSRPPGTRASQFYYVANFKDYRFLQVFYPTRGILAVVRPRPRRSCSRCPAPTIRSYVQANAVWSPDGKYLVFARAEAKDPYPADGKMADYANDPDEVQIQYDLYRIPFNDGKGGTPEPIEGASHNGMSNSFPKVSPDGKWIVFVQATTAS